MGRQSQGGGRHTGGQRPRETRGGVGRGGIQVGRRTEPSDRKGHPQCSKAGEGEPQLGGSSPGGGHQEGMVGGWRISLVPSSPACCPPARTGGPGWHSVPPSAWEHHRENTQNALPFCAGLKKSPAEFSPKPSEPHPHPGSQHRERVAASTQNDGEADGRSPGGLQEPRGGDGGREGRGWGGRDITDGAGQQVGAQTRSPAPPWASPRLSFSAQLPPGGPGAGSSPAHGWDGQAGSTWGGRGHGLDCAQLQGKSSVSRACQVRVPGEGVPHTPAAPTPTSTGVTPASEAHGKRGCPGCARSKLWAPPAP